jgi:hypothetical protein
MPGKTEGPGYLIIAAVLTTVAIAQVIMAAGIDNNTLFRPVVISPHFDAASSSMINDTALAPYHRNPELVTLFKAEVRDTVLPGPRYMAFGPSAIGISMDPVILSALIVLGVIGIAAWYIRNYGGRENK